MEEPPPRLDAPGTLDERVQVRVTGSLGIGLPRPSPSGVGQPNSTPPPAASADRRAVSAACKRSWELSKCSA